LREPPRIIVVMRPAALLLALCACGEAAPTDLLPVVRALGDGGTLAAPDAAPRPDAGPRRDAGPRPDAGPPPDSGLEGAASFDVDRLDFGTHAILTTTERQLVVAGDPVLPSVVRLVQLRQPGSTFRIGPPEWIGERIQLLPGEIRRISVLFSADRQTDDRATLDVEGCSSGCRREIALSARARQPAILCPEVRFPDTAVGSCVELFLDCAIEIEDPTEDHQAAATGSGFELLLEHVGLDQVHLRARFCPTQAAPYGAAGVLRFTIPNQSPSLEQVASFTLLGAGL
jgi:hypothetical protein